MHEEWEFRNLPREENSWKRLEKSQGRGLEWKREYLGDEQARTDRERSKKWEIDHEERIYRPLVNLDKCRCREVSRNLSRYVSRKWLSTVEVSSNKELDPRTEAQSIHHVSRSYRGGRSILDRSTRYRGGVEPSFQNSFLRGEKHKHECNPTYNSTNDPINTIISQNSLSI